MINDQIEPAITEVGVSNKKSINQKPCLFTLIVYFKEIGRLSYLQEVLDVIAAKFPCRVIFIQLIAEASENYLKIDTESNSLGGMPFKRESCDIYSIQCSISLRDKVPFLVLPYIVTDLPIYLWWGDELGLNDEALNKLLQISSRAIIDTGDSQEWKQTATNILSLIKQSQKEILDLNWSKIGGWRTTLAKVFDTEERLNDLNHCKTMEIDYNIHSSYVTKGRETQAVYLQAWIAAQMGWTLKSFSHHDSQIHVDYHYKGNDIRIIISSVEDTSAPEGSILSFKLTTYDDCFYSLMRKSTQSQVVVHIATVDQCQMPLNIPLQDCHFDPPLIQQLIYAPISKHYIHLLHLIASY